MKKSTNLLLPITIVVLFLIPSGACKKDSPALNNNKLDEFTVLEYVSNIPIKGATVTAYTCGRADWPFSCSDYRATLIGTALTDDSGKVSFNSSNVRFLEIRKDKYWELESLVAFSNHVLNLAPIATLKVRIVKVNQYPSGYELRLLPQSLPQAQAQAPGGCECRMSTPQNLIEPKDTIVYLKGAGNFQNFITWSVYPGGGSFSNTQQIMINRFDTAEFQIEY
jgi:hypothetical protein